jgi:VWFA-related protein
MLRIPVLLLVLWTSAESQERRYTLSVDVELVNVAAMVVDADGRYVEGLTQNDFRVLENGKEQEIAFFSHDRVPVSIGVLIDASGSHQDKLRQGLQTVRAIGAALSAGDEMFVITFNTRAVIRQKFTSDQGEIQHALRDFRAHGETAFFDALSMGLREMDSAKNKKRILLLVTDGFDTRSKIKAPQAEELVAKSDVVVYAIGIDDGDGDSPGRKRPKYRIYDYMLNRLTSAGNGRLVRLRTGKEYDLQKIASTLTGELQQEYTMGYYPADPGPEGIDTRSIEVRVKTPGVRILGERLHLLSRDLLTRP